MDYDSLVLFSRIHSSNFLGENVQRSLFKINYLKDYSGAIYDLEKRVFRIPKTHLRTKPLSKSRYNETYFILGLARYYNGNYEGAYKNWLKAMEFGYEGTGRDHALKHFDTIIPKLKDVPELYLSRAIANYSLASPSQKKEVRENHIKKSLNDLSQAKKLGFSDFRVNYYSAKAWVFLKQYDKALEEINIAIKKKNEDPRLYLERHYIRRKMNKISYKEYNNDSDFLTYKRLIKSWIFPK